MDDADLDDYRFERPPPGGRTSRRGPIRLDPEVAEIVDDIAHFLNILKKDVVARALREWIHRHRGELEAAIGDADRRLREYRTSLVTLGLGIPLDAVAQLETDDDQYNDLSAAEKIEFWE